MGKHRAGRTTGFFTLISTRPVPGRLDDSRVRLSTAESIMPAGISVLQAMEILERIADRRAQQVGVSLGLVDRIQPLA